MIFDKFNAEFFECAANCQHGCRARLALALFEFGDSGQ